MKVFAFIAACFMSSQAMADAYFPAFVCQSFDQGKVIYSVISASRESRIEEINGIPTVSGVNQAFDGLTMTGTGDGIRLPTNYESLDSFDIYAINKERSESKPSFYEVAISLKKNASGSYDGFGKIIWTMKEANNATCFRTFR